MKSSENKLLYRVAAILRRERTPLHFSDVAALVNQNLASDNVVNTHTVHATLTRYPEIFVYRDQGTYGMAEWGLKKQKFILDILIEILEEENKALEIGEIIKLVNEIRPSNKNSIIMYVTMKETFFCDELGRYGLSKWIQKNEKNENDALSDEFLQKLKERAKRSLDEKENKS